MEREFDTVKLTPEVGTIGTHRVKRTLPTHLIATKVALGCLYVIA